MPKLTAGENVTLTINVGADTLTVAVLTETVQDLVGSLILAGTGITATYDDGAGELTIAATAPDLETIYDAIGTMITAGSGLTKAVDDALNTMTLSVDAEIIRTIIGATLLPGTGLTVVIDDEANTITISAPENLSEEEVQDIIGAMVVSAGGTYDDAEGTFTMPPLSVDTEQVQDVLGAMVVAAGGTYDDTEGTFTLPTGTTTEDVQDIIGAMITAAGGTYDDAENEITLPSGGLEDPTTSNGDLIVSSLPAATNWATVAQGASATASSNAFGQPPGNVLDASDASYWATDYGAGGWLKIDLGVAREVGSFTWGDSPFNAGATPFTIESSPDDSTWTLRDTTLLTADRALTLPGPITARYWRFAPTDQTTSQNWGFESFQILSNPEHTIERLPVGTEGQILKSRLAETLDLKWESEFVTVNFVFPAIAAAQVVDAQIDFAFEIVSATILGNASGGAVFQVDKATYAAFPTMTNIDASAPPTLSAAQKSTDATLTGWTKTGAAGDILRVTVTSATTLTAATLALKVKKL